MAAVHFTLAELIIDITLLGYIIEFDKFNQSLKINISKKNKQ